MEKYNSEVDRTYTELPYEDKLDYVRTVDDEEDSGCCNFTNQFYLMNSFAGTFTCIVIIQIFGILLLGFLWPACFCGDFWAHLTLLPKQYQAIYWVVLIYIMTFTVLGSMALKGVYGEAKGKIYPFLVILIFTEIGLFFGAFFAFYKFGEVKQEVVTSMDDEEMKYIMDLVFTDKISRLLQSSMAVMADFLAAALGDAELDLESAMQEIFKPEMLVLIETGERIMKFVVVMSMLGINGLFVGTILSLFKLIGRLNAFKQMTAVPVPNGYHSPVIYERPITSKSNYAPSILSTRHRLNEEELLVPGNPSLKLEEAEYFSK